MEERVCRKNETSPFGEGYLDRKSILLILLILSQLLPIVISICMVTAKETVFCQSL